MAPQRGDVGMGVPEVRLCHCGTRLARDNRTGQCASCRQQARDRQLRPPTVTADFWQHDTMLEALASWHMGKVIAAYRLHPDHGRPISQETAAHWLGVTQARLSQIENGEPIQDLGKLVELAELLDIPAELLWFRLPGQRKSIVVAAPPIPDTDALRSLANDVADESVRFADRAAEPNLADDMLEHLHWEISRIAVDYVHAPLHTIFADLVKARNEIFELLDHGQRPRHARDLHFLGGVTCMILAHASQNVGNERAAMTQLRAAWKLADVADDDSLRAWTRGTAALINEWSLHQTKAVELASRGAQFGSSRESRIRLAAIEARSAARVGHHERARQALAQLQVIRDSPDSTDDVVQFGGLLSFPEAKQQYYLGSTYALLGEHDAAERHAQAAITSYETGLPAERSYGDEALARLDIVNVRLAKHDLDGAAEATAPVLALPENRMIRQFELPIVRIRSLLAQPQFAGAQVGRDLQDGLHHFQEQLRAANPGLPSSR